MRRSLVGRIRLTGDIGKLTCRQTTYLVTSARDTPLSGDQVAALDVHLAHCGACRTAQRQFGDLFAHLETLLARGQR